MANGTNITTASASTGDSLEFPTSSAEVVLPPETSHVSLSNAMSWIISRKSTDSIELVQLFDFEKFSTVETQNRKDNVTKLWNEFIHNVREGGISLFGKLFSSKFSKIVHVDREEIPKIKIYDYNGWDVVNDGLTVKPGIFWPTFENGFLQQSKSPLPAFRSVLVCRKNLLHFYPQKCSSAPAQKSKPGPKPNPNWGIAVEDVTKACWIKGFSTPLKNGQKTKIQNMLLENMLELGSDVSSASALKYAANVISALPDGKASDAA